MHTEAIKAAFRERFGAKGRIFTSPGRINLIGEHTDYNGGYVFPGAIDKGISCMIQLAPESEKVRLYSIDLDEECSFGLNEADAPQEQWARYIFGVCRELIKRGYKVQPFDAVFAGDVPLGAGMSSSAALESCFGFALDQLHSFGIDRFELARIGQATEHNYVGVKCGIMDQFASLFGKAGKLMRLDCMTMEYQYYPFDPLGYKLILLDTRVKHQLADSAYNRRRESCEAAVAAIASKHSQVQFLRQASLEMLEEARPLISDEDYLRAKYVIEEVKRVEDVCVALEADDYETVGAKMYQTHWGMSKLYEVSCPELDFLVRFAEQKGVSGARVMGGGFGGCTINLLREELYESFVGEATRAFEQEFGHKPLLYQVQISDGARELANE